MPFGDPPRFPSRFGATRTGWEAKSPGDALDITGARLIRFVSDLDALLRKVQQTSSMTRIQLVPERNTEGTVVLRAVVRGPFERLRRLVRRLVLSA